MMVSLICLVIASRSLAPVCFEKSEIYECAKTFYEYRLLKHEDKPASVSYLAWVGLANLVLGVLFIILHLSGIGNIA